MNIREKFKKERLVFGAYLLVLIVVMESILHTFHLPGWPVFMVMIFFFESHMDLAKAPNILLGGIVGIICFVLTVEFIQLSAGFIDPGTARIIFICLVVYAIVAFGEIFPKVFNNYAFMYYLISGLAAFSISTTSTPDSQSTLPHPFIWMLLVLFGGSAVIAAIVGLRILVAKTLGLPLQAPSS
ncbi:hypothetical protein TDB9533_01638 [Thalassocella blandensis]|nr:hypothetical protein TDB9533_01638 [Thalassocella blandensis]